MAFVNGSTAVIFLNFPPWQMFQYWGNAYVIPQETNAKLNIVASFENKTCIHSTYCTEEELRQYKNDSFWSRNKFGLKWPRFFTLQFICEWKSAVISRLICFSTKCCRSCIVFALKDLFSWGLRAIFWYFLSPLFRSARPWARKRIWHNPIFCFFPLSLEMLSNTTKKDTKLQRKKSFL